MQAERINSLAAGNGDKRRGKREKSWKAVRQQDHNKDSISHAERSVYIRLRFEQAILVQTFISKIIFATLQCSVIAHHNFDLKIL